MPQRFDGPKYCGLPGWIEAEEHVGAGSEQKRQRNGVASHHHGHFRQRTDQPRAADAHYDANDSAQSTQ